MLFPEIEESAYGSRRRRIVFTSDYDVRNLLPKSLESLHLEGAFIDPEWEDISAIFERPNDHVPNLSNVYLERKPGTDIDDTTFAVGGSEQRHRILNIEENPLSKLLHGENAP